MEKTTGVNNKTYAEHLAELGPARAYEIEKLKRQWAAQKQDIEVYEWPLYVFGKWPRILYKKVSNFFYHDSFMGSWSISALQDLVLTLSVAYLLLVFLLFLFYKLYRNWRIRLHEEEHYIGSFDWYMRDSNPIRDFKPFYVCCFLLMAYLLGLLVIQLPELLHYLKMYEWLTYYCAVDHKVTFMNQRQFKGNRPELMDLQLSKVKAPARPTFLLYKPW
jgi:hypothetical protein